MLDEFEARERREAEAREKAASDEQDLRNALRLLLGTAEGKRVVFWLLGRCGVYANPFDVDAGVERYRLGRQSVGLELLRKIEQVDARLYPRLLLDMSEAKELDRAAKETAARRAAPEDGEDQYA